MNKKWPILYKQKKECCGCGVCCIICPRNAIYMFKDEKGFKYPTIEQEKCVKCYRCIKICPMKNN